MNKRINEYYKKLSDVKEKLMYYKSPLILYDDDPDGVSSFILMFRYLKDAYYTLVKSSPNVSSVYLSKVVEYNPDVIIILDKPLLDESFIEEANLPIFWFDHHIKQKIRHPKLIEINPRDYGITNRPTAHIIYDFIYGDSNNKDSIKTNQDPFDKDMNNLYIATLGCIGDWTLPDFFDKFNAAFPNLASGKVKVEDVLFNSDLGKIIKKVSFALKLPTKKYKKAIKYLLKVNDPYDLLNNYTEESQEFNKKIEYIEEEYNKLLYEAKKSANDSEIIVFIYDAIKNSFTKEISNEMLYLYPNKTIIIGRKKDNEVKMSIRSPKTIPPILEKVLINTNGHGGGHEHACGAVVPEENFDFFIQTFIKEIKNNP
jgi:single-stranded DNA-specific DHH superfamily exonuclease